MTSRIVVRSVLAALSAAALGTAFAAPASTPAAPEAKAAFARLKGLVGTWEGTAGDAQNAMPVKLVYEVTGNGSAVKETLFPGTPHEMLTLYHLDGPSLVLTHYCAAGNQPRMKLARAVAGPPYELVFDFAGGSNLDAAKDMHMHSARIRLLEDGRLESEWASFQGGQPLDVKKFTVSRKK